MYTVAKVHKLVQEGNYGMLLSGYAVIDESGSITKDGTDYNVFRLKSTAQKVADYLNTEAERIHQKAIQVSRNFPPAPCDCID